MSTERSAFEAIKAIHYTVVVTRDMAAMRGFYEGVMRFAVTRVLSENWIEYQIGPTILALSNPGLTRDDGKHTGNPLFFGMI